MLPMRFRDALARGRDEPAAFVANDSGIASLAPPDLCLTAAGTRPASCRKAATSARARHPLLDQLRAQALSSGRGVEWIYRPQPRSARSRHAERSGSWARQPRTLTDKLDKEGLRGDWRVPRVRFG